MDGNLTGLSFRERRNSGYEARFFCSMFGYFGWL
jgi:hypothetical protein